MEIHVANPIYDIVFKFLMEDQRAARTLLSALLKKEVLEVQMRQHEYINGSRDTISLFRIDFHALVRDAKGKEEKILIELQKNWVETEVLRFRQYLGTHYLSPDNMKKTETPKGEIKKVFAYPMVTIYLLGHLVGDIEEPVVYVNHEVRDYDGNVVAKGKDDPFVNSLNHSSIIVQIPRLPKWKQRNRLGTVLSIFDQTKRTKESRQVLRIEETKYESDEELKHILHRLLVAAADVEVRRDMNVEDEFFQAIEDRDTAIMVRDSRIKKQDAQLAEQGAQLAEKDTQLAKKDTQLEEQKVLLRSMISALMQTGHSLETISLLTGTDLTVIKQIAEEGKPR